MAVDATALRTELGAGPSTLPGGIPDEFLDGCLAVADDLLKKYAGATYRTDGTIPVPVAEKAWLAVAVEIVNQRRAPNGVLNQAFTTDGGTLAQAVRISADPLRPAYGLLGQWVSGKFFVL